MSKRALAVLVGALALTGVASVVSAAPPKPKTSPTATTLCATTLIPTGTTYTQTDVNLVVTNWCANMNITMIDSMVALSADDVKKILCFNKALPNTAREPNLTCS